MSKQQRDAIDAALRAEPFDLGQSTAEHRHEVLLDDAVRLAANAGRDDVEVTLQVAYEGTHVFQRHLGRLAGSC